jgi:hypothetical protein
MRLRRNTFAAATWSESEIVWWVAQIRARPATSDRRKTPAPGADQRVSDDWDRRSILVGRGEQIELHPCDVVPAVVFPFDAPV